MNCLKFELWGGSAPGNFASDAPDYKCGNQKYNIIEWNLPPEISCVNNHLREQSARLGFHLPNQAIPRLHNNKRPIKPTLSVADIGFHFPPRPKFLAYRPKDPPPRRAPLKYWAETIFPPARAPLPPPPKSATVHYRAVFAGRRRLIGKLNFKTESKIVY